MRPKHLAASLYICLSVIFYGQEICAQTSSNGNLMLHQSGARIVDAQAREVRLRGVNLGGWLCWEGWIFGKGILTHQSQMLTRLYKTVGRERASEFQTEIYNRFITEDDIRSIAQSGFNCVRVPLHYKLFDDPAGWQIVDRLLEWCERYHVYAVLDMHEVPGCSVFKGEPEPLWKSKQTQDKLVEDWRMLAARYNKRTIVAGYDLVNEPVPPSGRDLISIYERIIRVIRQTDPNHMLFVEGGKYATDFSMFQTPLDPNLTYSFHMYTWFGDHRGKDLKRYTEFSRKANAPLWCGEFGENTYDKISSTVDMYARCPEIKGWTFWTWKKAPNCFPGLVTINISPTWDRVINWLGKMLPSQAPPKLVIEKGMQEFEEAIILRNCNFDDRMAQALRLK